MIPLQDVVPSRTPPVVTLALIAMMGIVLLCESGLPAQQVEWVLEHGGLVPPAFAWLTLLTALFLHAGWLPALANMGALWIFGDNVEDRLGHGRFLLCYLACGALGLLVHAWTDAHSLVPTVGGGTAVAAVMGAHIAWFPRGRVLVLVPLVVAWDIIEVPSLWLLVAWLLLQTVGGLWLPVSPGLLGAGPTSWALLAGFGAGAGLGRLLGRAERARIEWYEPSGA